MTAPCQSNTNSVKVAQITLSLLYIPWRAGSLKHLGVVYDEICGELRALPSTIPKTLKQTQNTSEQSRNDTVESFF